LQESGRDGKPGAKKEGACLGNEKVRKFVKRENEFAIKPARQEKDKESETTARRSSTAKVPAKQRGKFWREKNREKTEITGKFGKRRDLLTIMPAKKY